MARWSFFVPSKEVGTTVEVADEYNPDSAEDTRQRLREIHGDKLVIKIDGREIPSNLGLK